jgi:hypothetical protein
MTASEAKQMIAAAQAANSKLADKVCLGTEDLTLTAAALPLPFTALPTGTTSTDVGGVIIKVRKIGSPTDATYLLRYTQKVGDVPVAATKGMWMGDGDLFEINNNTNVVALKLIATDALFCTITIEYYGK